MDHDAIIALLGVAITVGGLLWNAQRAVVRRIESRQKILLEAMKWTLEKHGGPEHLVGQVAEAIKNGG